MGRGEEQAGVHPRARELAALLLERGAEPYDQQILYNLFARHASFGLFDDDDFVWLLEMIYQESVKRGRSADWTEPEWRMLDMGGYGAGAWHRLVDLSTPFTRDVRTRVPGAKTERLKSVVSADPALAQSRYRRNDGRTDRSRTRFVRAAALLACD